MIGYSNNTATKSHTSNTPQMAFERYLGDACESLSLWWVGRRAYNLKAWAPCPTDSKGFALNLPKGSNVVPFRVVFIIRRRKQVIGKKELHWSPWVVYCLGTVDPCCWMLGALTKWANSGGLGGLAPGTYGDTKPTYQVK